MLVKTLTFVSYLFHLPASFPSWRNEMEARLHRPQTHKRRPKQEKRKRISRSFFERPCIGMIEERDRETFIQYSRAREHCETQQIRSHVTTSTSWSEPRRSSPTARINLYIYIYIYFNKLRHTNANTLFCPSFTSGAARKACNANGWRRNTKTPRWLLAIAKILAEQSYKAFVTFWLCARAIFSYNASRGNKTLIPNSNIHKYTPVRPMNLVPSQRAQCGDRGAQKQN